MMMELYDRCITPIQSVDIYYTQCKYRWCGKRPTVIIWSSAAMICSSVQLITIWPSHDSSFMHHPLHHRPLVMIWQLSPNILLTDGVIMGLSNLNIKWSSVEKVCETGGKLNCVIFLSVASIINDYNHSLKTSSTRAVYFQLPLYPKLSWLVKLLGNPGASHHSTEIADSQPSLCLQEWWLPGISICFANHFSLSAPSTIKLDQGQE